MVEIRRSSGEIVKQISHDLRKMRLSNYSFSLKNVILFTGTKFNLHTPWRCTYFSCLSLFDRKEKEVAEEFWRTWYIAEIQQDTKYHPQCYERPSR